MTRRSAGHAVGRGGGPRVRLDWLLVCTLRTAAEAEYVRDMFDLMRRGLIGGVTDDVRRVLGRDPRTFGSYVAEAAAGAWLP